MQQDRDDFWRIIGRAGQAASRNDDEAFTAAVTAELSGAPPEELIDFKVWFEWQSHRADRWDLWGAAHVMMGGCGDDGFEMFRAWLVAQGKETFERVLQNPEHLAELDVEEPDTDCAMESLIYVTVDPYERKTGRSIYDDLPEPEGEGWGGTAGEPFDEDTVHEQYPRIAAKWGG